MFFDDFDGAASSHKKGGKGGKVGFEPETEKKQRSASNDAGEEPARNSGRGSDLKDGGGGGGRREGSGSKNYRSSSGSSGKGRFSGHDRDDGRRRRPAHLNPEAFSRRDSDEGEAKWEFTGFGRKKGSDERPEPGVRGRSTIGQDRAVKRKTWKPPTDITRRMLTMADGNMDFDSRLDAMESDMNIARRLQDSGNTGDELRRDFHEEHSLLSFAGTLHQGLIYLWVPMLYLGRLPFRLLLKKDKAVIYVTKQSGAFIACYVTCIALWVVFAWITLGLFFLLMLSTKSESDTAKVSVLLAKRYWSGVFIFWTILLQACVSTTEILKEAEELAAFIKDWYRVLDSSKIDVSRTLKRYIIINEVVLGVFIFGMIVVFSLDPETFSHLRGTAWVIVIGLGEPIIWFFHVRSSKTHYEGGSFYFQRWSFVGLLLYIVAVLFSGMYIVQFMVFCRCFRKGLHCINNRLAIVLDVDDLDPVGSNGERLTYEYIHKDLLNITLTGGKIGHMYKWTMCNYYLWSVIVLVVELGEIFIFVNRDHRKLTVKEHAARILLEGTGIPKILDAHSLIVNQVLQLAVSAVLIFVVSYEAAGANKEGKVSYELARYRGLVEATTISERNFIRSIWIIYSEKCPIHVAPGKFFGVTNSTVLTTFATAFTYFIFWVQSQGQLKGEPEYIE